MPPAPKRPRYTKAQRLKILLENAHLFTEKEVCEKWGITPYRLRKWKEEFDFTPWLGGEEAWVTAVLYRPAGIGVTLGQLAFTLDMKNHLRYSDEEILLMLRSLEKKGIAVRRDGLWYYDQSHCPRGMSFIF